MDTVTTRTAVLFGGPSPEYEVSLRSALSVYRALRDTPFRARLVGMTRDGVFRLFRESEETPTLLPENALAVLPSVGGFYAPDTGDVFPFDVLFPVMHGGFGEDGGFYGLSRYIGVKVVGCPATAAGISMDKRLTKRLLRTRNIPVLPCFTVKESDAARAFRKLGNPVFIKPASAGSSVGCAVARNESEFRDAWRIAARYGEVLAERFFPAREIEVALCDFGKTRVFSAPGEAPKRGDVYSYREKYEDATLSPITEADLSPREKSLAVRLARRAAEAVGVRGTARIDLFYDGRTMVVNEINTCPGFSDKSIYPMMLCQTLGIPYQDLLCRLICAAEKP